MTDYYQPTLIERPRHKRRCTTAAGSAVRCDPAGAKFRHEGGLLLAARSASAQLDKGEIQPLVALIRSLVGERPELAVRLNTEAEYFERNAAQMRYPDFRAQGLFVGPGVIEASDWDIYLTFLRMNL